MQWPKDTTGVIRSVHRRGTDNAMAKRYHRGNQKPYIEEVQTMQWTKDTTGVIRSRTSKRYRQCNGQKIPQG